MSPCSLSLGQGLRILEMVFCALAFIIPMFRGSMSSPYGIWCEFVWVFGLVVAVVIFVIEKCLVDKLIEILVLKHTWDDLSCGLTLLSSIMLLSASLIYSTVFVCSTCIADMICASASILACVAYVLDGVKLKLKCPEGYLSRIRGVLRFMQAFVACLLFTAVYTCFKGVEIRVPGGLIWCILVYVVCFLPTVVVILTHLQKCVNLLKCFDLNKLELVFDAVAVALYVSAAIIWPVFGYKNYKRDSKFHETRIHDINLVTIMTYVNLGLYIADLVLTLIVYCKNK
ncbi:myeloid-associated differentiation marker-like protein 2 [Pimephales promelas]|uniref:myeloid-associated differentiation marker-like protein 2 n=1 Tax=Pimephales promelas TaxID=90988 RepID=UPI001955B4DF|nr:myeloid-associated differentiation marker-like protein 2 [Pimephales promelas]